MIIHLQNLEFFAFHGVFKEEQILGNKFLVDVKVYCNRLDNPNILLEQTVNYAEIFSVVNAIMQQPTPLLESLVIKIGSKILEQFLQVNKVDVSIYKHQPPIKDYKGSVGVQQIFERSF